MHACIAYFLALCVSAFLSLLSYEKTVGAKSRKGTGRWTMEGIRFGSSQLAPRNCGTYLVPFCDHKIRVDTLLWETQSSAAGQLT